MDYSTGNQFPFASGAGYNSTNNLANGFAPAGTNNMPFNGVYGNNPAGVPNYGGAYNAPPQHIPMGYSGLTQPMSAGMPPSHSHHPAAATQGLPMASGRYNAPTTYGMRPGMSMAPQRVQHPAMATQGLPMANGPHYAPMTNGMLPGMPMAPLRAQHPAAGIPMANGHHNAAIHEQRPAPLVALANLGNGDAYNAPQLPAAAPVPVAQTARPAEVVDLTNDNEEPAPAPITPTAGTKRAREDRTSNSSAKLAKRPRYTAFGPHATPLATPQVVNLPSASTPPTLSFSATASDAEVLPATPSPSERPRVPRKRPEDPYNLRGAIHYTFMQAPKNSQFEENTRPVYSRPLGLPATSATSKRGPKGKKGSKTGASAGEAVEAAASDSTTEPVSSPETIGADAEEDAEFELDDDVLAPAAVSPAAATLAPVETAEAPAEEERDDSDDIVFDDDGNVITDAQDQPITLSAWRAKQAAILAPLDTGSTASTYLPATCITVAALNKSTSPAKKTAAPKRPTVSCKKVPSQRPTVSGKKVPWQRPTVSGKKLPSQKPTVSKKQAAAHKKRAPSPVFDDDDEDLEAQLEAQFAAECADDDESEDDRNSQPQISRKKTAAPKRSTVSHKKLPSQNPAAATPKRSSVSQKKLPSQTPVAVSPQETPESIEDKRTLRDLEAKFGDFRQIRVWHDFEDLRDALFAAWEAVGMRSGPFKDQWNAMSVKEGETAYDEWDHSEDESSFTIMRMK
jgi:hypothetical protein